MWSFHSVLSKYVDGDSGVGRTNPNEGFEEAGFKFGVRHYYVVCCIFGPRVIKLMGKDTKGTLNKNPSTNKNLSRFFFMRIIQPTVSLISIFLSNKTSVKHIKTEFLHLVNLETFRTRARLLNDD